MDGNIAANTSNKGDTMWNFIIPKLLKTKRCLCLSDLSLMTDFLTQIKLIGTKLQISHRNILYVLVPESQDTFF